MPAGNSSGCYFVGKQVLLNWISEFIKERVARVEDMSSGHQYLICLEAMYPGQINFSKVKNDAQLEWEKIENLKLVQGVLAKNNVERVVDVERLAKGKYQDNLEFFQWFKWWFDSQYDYSQPFDPVYVKSRIGIKSVAANKPHSPQNVPRHSPVVSQRASVPTKTVMHNPVTAQKP